MKLNLKLFLIIGLFSFFNSCSQSQEINDTDKLIYRFFNEQLLGLGESEKFVIIVPSSCDDCIKRNNNIVLGFNKKKLKLHFIVDSSTYLYLKDNLNCTNFKVSIINRNLFFKYNVTGDNMMLINSKNKKITKIERIVY